MSKIRRIFKIVMMFAVVVSIGVYPFLVAQAVDSLEADQWYLNNINAKQAWTITKGSSDVVVAVLDTGIDLDHPDLAGNIWTNLAEVPGDGIDNDNNGYIDDVNGWNFVQQTPSPEPDFRSGYQIEPAQHGTFVSGIISAVHDNNFGIKGMTGNVKIMSLPVLDPNGMGGSTQVTEAINYAVDNGANVINLSFAGDEHSDSLKSAVMRAYNNNVVIVAAAGNYTPYGLDLNAYVMYPICYDQEWGFNAIIGVAATDKNNKPAYFTNYGVGCVDIAAPGENIVGLAFKHDKITNLQDYFVSDFQGSSFSTAMVSGTVALMLSIDPTLTPEAVVDILQQTANEVLGLNAATRAELGSGLLNTYAAVKLTSQSVKPIVPQSPIPQPLTPTPTPTVPIEVNGLKIFTTPNSDRPALIQQYNSSLGWEKEIESFGDSFKGLNLNTADINNDGKIDLLFGATIGDKPFVRGLTKNEVLLASFLAFEENFKGGVRASAGDFNNDGEVEFVAVPQSQKEPVVRVFNSKKQLMKEFLAFDPGLKTGITVAVGNVLGDAADEIIVGAPQGADPEVKIFNFKGELLGTIMAYIPQFKGGVNVAVANVDGSGYDDIIVGAGVGGGPHVRIFSATGFELASFFVYNPSFRGGVYVGAGDYNQDGKVDIITAPGKSGGPHVRIWSSSGGMMAEFFAYEASFTSGIQAVIVE